MLFCSCISDQLQSSDGAQRIVLEVCLAHSMGVRSDCCLGQQPSGLEVDSCTTLSFLPTAFTFMQFGKCLFPEQQSSIRVFSIWYEQLYETSGGTWKTWKGWKNIVQLHSWSIVGQFGAQGSPNLPWRSLVVEKLHNRGCWLVYKLTHILLFNVMHR